jgi:predicted transcriptional regulator
MTKEAAIKVFNDLPDEFELDELLEKLIVIAKIERGLKDVEEGRTITHEELLKQIKTWSK